jgi:hypothetical protein
MLRPGDLPDGILDRLRRQRRVDPGEDLDQRPPQEDVAVPLPLGEKPLGRDLRSEPVRIAERLELGDRGPARRRLR